MFMAPGEETMPAWRPVVPHRGCIQLDGADKVVPGGGRAWEQWQGVFLGRRG